MIAKKKLLLIWLIGSMSGFTIMISGNTLNFWLAKEGINITTIGIFALISLPYAINFLWAPIIDTKNIPILSKTLGPRTSWIVVIQVLLSIAVYILSRVNPSSNLLLFAIIGLMVSFLSSTQDTILGAFRTDIIESSKQGQVSGIYIFGYRIGMLLSSSVAIYISSYIQWSLVYEIFSIVILSFPIVFLLLSRGMETSLRGVRSTTWQSLVSRDPHVRPSGLPRDDGLISKIISSMGSKKYIILVLIFLILYRLPDNFISMMINPFLLHIGYDEFEISIAGKFFGITNAIIGGLLAGFIMKYFNIFRSLLFFGALHAIAHTLFILQEIYGKNIELLILVTGFESITGGMTMAAYIGFIASLCKGRFKATQYAFLSSMMGLSRSALPAFSGYVVTIIGWKMFYLFAALATIPSLVLVVYLEKNYWVYIQNAELKSKNRQP